MSRRRGEESCPFLDGVYVSVMRRFASTSFFLKTGNPLLLKRIINPGFHKQLLSEVELMLTTTLLPDRLDLTKAMITFPSPALLSFFPGDQVHSFGGGDNSKGSFC